MSTKQFRALLTLNAALLAILAAIVLAPSADAQNRANRARGEYTMVSGRMLGAVEDAIWIIDAANEELLALRWNNSAKRLDGIGYRDLSQDAAQAGRRGR